MEVNPSFEGPNFGTRQNKLQLAIPFTSTKRRPIAQSSGISPASTSLPWIRFSSPITRRPTFAAWRWASKGRLKKVHAAVL